MAPSAAPGEIRPHATIRKAPRQAHTASGHSLGRNSTPAIVPPAMDHARTLWLALIACIWKRSLASADEHHRGNRQPRSNDFAGIDGVHRDAQPSEAIDSRADTLYQPQRGVDLRRSHQGLAPFRKRLGISNLGGRYGGWGARKADGPRSKADDKRERYLDLVRVHLNPPPARRHDRFRRQFLANVQLQTSRHPVHAHVPRAPAAQVGDQADIGGRPQHQDQDVCKIHALI